jgi:transcriptional regulator GlxA family with amidase domain
VDSAGQAGKVATIDEGMPLQVIRLRSAIAYMQPRSGRSVSVAQVAEFVGVSQSGLRSIFQAHLGMAPSRYLKMIRLEHARLLLCTGTKSVKEIMAEAGFSDPSHFVRDFEKQFGLSPSRYRSRYFEASLTSPLNQDQ